MHAETGDAEADDVVWLGGMYPLTSTPGLIGEVRAADLARQDFSVALGSSSTRSGSLHARRIGLVICDEDIDPLRAARHLVENVEAPAVLGFRAADTAMKTIAGELLPNHVLSFVTISQAPALTRIPEPPGEPRLVWRSTLDRNDFVAPLVAFVEQVLEPAARARKGSLRRGAPGRPFRVAAVWAKAANHELIDLIFASLNFNGKSALENGSDFRQFVYETDNGSALAPDLVGDLLTFAPDIVFFANANFIPKVLTPLEAGWDHEPRPVYLTASGLGPALGEFAGRDAGRRHRFFASNNVATSMPNAQLVLRYNLAFPTDPVVRAEAPQPSYDAFYTLAYAIHALGDGAISGPALAGAIQRLVPPAPIAIDVGPAKILEAFGALRGLEGRVDLNGALGGLDFDPATGEAPIAFAIDCLGVDDQGAATESVDSGLVFDPRSGLLRGHLQCP